MRHLALGLLLLAILALSGCVQQPAQTSNWQAVEVRDYKGENLSSISDFRENSIKGPQHINISNYTLEISGLVGSPSNLTYAQVLSHQSVVKVVDLHCVEGWSVKILWEGVRISDLLNDAGLKSGAKTVIFYSYDGYSTSLPLDYVTSKDIILAYKINNVTLPDERGFPFQVVAESKLGYKWAKWVTRIEVSDSDYLGYWESRGYGNGADI